MIKKTLLIGLATLTLSVPSFAAEKSAKKVKSIEIGKSRPQPNLLGEVKRGEIPKSFFYEKVSPIIKHERLLRAGYITPDEKPYGKIIDADIRGKDMGVNDIVYIDRGRADSLEDGDQFFVYRPIKTVKEKDERTGKDKVLGDLITIVGKIEVVKIQEPIKRTSKSRGFFSRSPKEDMRSKAAKCVIVQHYDSIFTGDLIIPVFDLFIPEVDEDKPLAEKEINGKIVAVSFEDRTVATGDIIYLNVGRKNGVEEGDVFGIYNVPPDDSPADKYGYRRLLGKAQAIIVKDGTSTAIIRHSTEEIEIGNNIAFLQER